MSAPSTHRRDLQSQSSLNTATSLTPNHPPKWLFVASYSLLLSGAALSLVGCQSTHGVASSTHVSQSMMDFNSANPAQSNAQGHALNAQLDANAVRYQQLFDQSQNPNTETQARRRLLTAINQHLASEHVAVAQAHYNVVPFVNPSSIDAGSSGLLRTIIELYAYKNAQSDDDEDYDYDEESYDEYDDYVDEADEVVIVEEEAYESVVIEYDADGYDAYGYNEYGYNAEGYDEYGYDWYGYDAEGYDEDGYDENGYDIDANQRVDEEDARGGILSGLARFSPLELLSHYEAMQAQKQSKTGATNTDTSAYYGVIGQLLGDVHKTPEQVAAQNAYQYQPLVFNSVSHYKPAQKQFQNVYSYDYLSPTLSSSIQIPLALDFNNSQLTLDASALLPVLALVAPEQTPLPEQLTSHTIDFGLPETITAHIPTPIIYDALIAAVQSSMAEIAPEYFTAVDIRDDDFAKQLGADSVVKLNFDSKQSGEMIGRIFKHVSQSLARYVEDNPEKYPDDAPLKTAIHKIQTYNKGYQSADVGALLQLIEAIAPFSFNHTNYYYLNNAERLLGKQQRTSFGGDLMGSQMVVLNQIRYDDASFRQHALTPLLQQSFGTQAPPAIDGNAWIQQAQQKKALAAQARYARYDYDYEAEEEKADTDEDVDIEYAQ